MRAGDRADFRDVVGHDDDGELIAAQTGGNIPFAQTARNRSATATSTASPVASPSVSLTALNWSRSRQSNAHASFGAGLAAWCHNSSNDTLFASLVRPSCRARKAIVPAAAVAP